MMLESCECYPSWTNKVSKDNTDAEVKIVQDFDVCVDVHKLVALRLALNDS